MEHFIFYLRLLTDNNIELVQYDIQGLKEIKRNKYINNFEVSQVCLVEDQCKVINYSTVDDFYKNAVLGFMKDTKEWSFRQVSDYTTELFKFVGYNLSVWSVYRNESS